MARCGGCPGCQGNGLPRDLAEARRPPLPLLPRAHTGFIFVEVLRKMGEASCLSPLLWRWLYRWCSGELGSPRGLETPPVPLGIQQQQLAALGVCGIGVQEHAWPRSRREVRGFGAPSCKLGLWGAGLAMVSGPGVQGWGAQEGRGFLSPKD